MVIRDWYETEVDLCEYWHVCKTRMSTRGSKFGWSSKEAKDCDDLTVCRLMC